MKKQSSKSNKKILNKTSEEFNEWVDKFEYMFTNYELLYNASVFIEIKNNNTKCVKIELTEGEYTITDSDNNKYDCHICDTRDNDTVNVEGIKEFITNIQKNVQLDSTITIIGYPNPLECLDYNHDTSVEILRNILGVFFNEYCNIDKNNISMSYEYTDTHERDQILKKDSFKFTKCQNGQWTKNDLSKFMNYLQKMLETKNTIIITKDEDQEDHVYSVQASYYVDNPDREKNIVIEW